MKRDDEPVVIEQDFDQSVASVWNAITNIDEMRKWYFENIPEFRAESGFRTQFSVESGNRTFLHLWEVIEVVHQNTLTYTWKFEGIEGDSLTRFVVSGNDQSAHLKLTVQVLEDYPEDIPEFSTESCIGGWTYFIKDRLKTYLDG